MLGKEEIVQELIRKYNIDLEKLEKEQLKLAKELQIKDSMDFSDIKSVAGIDSVFLKNKIISSVVVCNALEDFEIIEKDYSIENLKFPYISGFRAYRELPAMLNAFQKIEERPELVFIRAHGITHPRLGLASHFSLSAKIPSIGVSEKLIIGEVDGDNIILNKKIVGKIFHEKKGSKPLYISPGNLVSVETAFELTKKLTKYPHKFPEPLHLVRKFAKKVKREIC